MENNGNLNYGSYAPEVAFNYDVQNFERSFSNHNEIY